MALPTSSVDASVRESCGAILPVLAHPAIVSIAVRTVAQAALLDPRPRTIHSQN
jgi:hypothetical protein